MNHSKLFLKYLFVLLVVLSVQSCSEFLEQEPGSQTSIAEQLSTKNGMLVALNGTYGKLEENVRGERFAVYADLQGGNLKFTPTISGSNRGQIAVPINIENVYSFQDQALESNFTPFYDASYTVVNQVNLILENVDQLTDATAIEKNQIKAEALAIRAYAHFLLTLVYSQPISGTGADQLGVVYSTASLSKGIQYPKRETLANTYLKIVADLNAALDNFSNVPSLAGPTNSYFNAINTKALMARVYLSQNKWQNAFDVANDVIQSSGISLVSSENYVAQWEQTNAPLSENLLEFSIPRDSGGEVGGSLSSYFGYFSPTNYNKYVASQDLRNLYETADIRRQLFLEKPLPTLVNGVLVNVNYYFTKKLQDNPGYSAFRLSEVYLIRAEAALALGNRSGAIADINTIRFRAKATLLTATENLEDALLLERRKELCFEGHLFFDLARKRKSIVRTDGCLATTCNLDFPSPKFVLPIPQKNINLNANLQQNETY
ncbi:RagB/SusD family nutrient uptake outer membrane protein [Flavobacterium sp. F-328]|uniref:RagB/SusD family nutrient uptake outer membrane protein n=1 Tax=Flavobacterium erciyesense TaxID=2825842 RepID=A0ABS5D1H3_9FLAO|nr:RagB/SusD family nutrient uptake outer membrane protein [Flavobacterium erciyesense]MBQ0907862.1 RagB/SusD family nutrient uptake outer membrane protein [Flavobacterium erciyesense]